MRSYIIFSRYAQLSQSLLYNFVLNLILPLTARNCTPVQVSELKLWNGRNRLFQFCYLVSNVLLMAITESTISETYLDYNYLKNSIYNITYLI